MFTKRHALLSGILFLFVLPFLYFLRAPARGTTAAPDVHLEM